MAFDFIPDQPTGTIGAVDSDTLIKQHFPPEAVDTAIKVMNAESSGNSEAINVNNNKSKDRGLFQINDVHIPELQEQGLINKPSDLFDPETNIKVAAYLHSKQGFEPWNASKEKWGETGFDFVPEDFNFKPGTVGQEGMSPGGFIRNVGSNIFDIGRGIKSLIANSPEIAAFANKYTPLNPLGIYNQVSEPEPLIQMWSDIGKSLIGAVQHPIRTMYEHPVDVALMASPVAKGGSLLAEAGNLPRVAKALGTVAKLTEPAEFVKGTVSKAPENIAARLINSRIKPRMRDFSYGKNPGLGVAREGIVATSLEDLAKKVATRRDIVGKQIDSIVNLPRYSNVTLDLSDSVNMLDDAIVQASKNPRTNSALISRLVDVKKDILQAYELPTGQVAYGRYLVSMSPSDALALKRDLGEITKWTGSMSDDQLVNKALKRMYGSIDSKLDKAIPELKTLNERYADLSGAYVATKHREQVLGRQNLTHIPGLATGLGTGVLTGEVLTGLGAYVLYETLASTLSKTAAASILAKMGVKMPQITKAMTTAGRAGVVSNIVNNENKQ